MTGLTELPAFYGSPLYVYEVDKVDAAVADLRDMLPDGATVFYSVKANPHPDLGARLRLAGCRAEISSPGELISARDAGFSMGECLYTGPAKTPAEIHLALRAGVRQFSVESAPDLDRVAVAALADGVVARCLVRVNLPLAGASGLRMGGGGRFGTDLDTAAKLTDRPGAELIGAHFFAVSGVHAEETLIGQAETSIEAAAQLVREANLPMSVLDLGGGFAAPYAAPGARPRYPAFRAAVEASLDGHFAGWRDGQPEVAFESGRYLVADSGSLVCTVTEIKQSGDQTFVLLDSGINHLGGMAGLGLMLPRTSIAAQEPAGRATFAGPLCTPADVLGRNVPVAGDLAPGDHVVIPNVGAYGLSASLIGFLSRPAPVEVVLDHGRVVSASQVSLARHAVNTNW